MAINIFVDSVYACHIAYLCQLLKLDTHRIISSNANKTFDFGSLYGSYYQRMLDKLQERTDVVLETVFFENFLKNTYTFSSIPDTAQGSISLIVTNNSSILAAQTQFFTLLDTNNIILDLHKYDTDFYAYRRVLTWGIQTILGRSPLPNEIDELYLLNAVGLWDTNHPNLTNLFSWLHILTFGTEGRSLDIDLPYINAFRSTKYTLPLKKPTFAVLVSGHMRDYENRINNHRVFTHNPYMDFFIHTWTQRGPRYEFLHTSPLDTVALSQAYPACISLIEDESTLLQGFSLRSVLNPIFLHHGQQGDDATRYVNSKLYSLWKAFTLAQQYESQTGTTYKAIMKLNVNVMYDRVNFAKMIVDVSTNPWGHAKNALYVPNIYPKKLQGLVNSFNPCRQPFTGGGCSRCDLEAKYVHYTYVPQHPYHHTDICETWWYANRLVGQKAAELYLSATSIMLTNHTSNLAAYPNCHYRQIHEFVYMKHPVQYQKRVYSVDDQSWDVLCFYPERLMREHMKGVYPCVSSSNITGQLSEFDIKTSKA